MPIWQSTEFYERSMRDEETGSSQMEIDGDSRRGDGKQWLTAADLSDQAADAIVETVPSTTRPRQRRSRPRTGGPENSLPRIPTLRSLKGETIVVECKLCRLYGEMDRKAVLMKFKASVTVSRLRRTIVGACHRMCADGVDSCDARVTSKARAENEEIGAGSERS